MENKNRIIMETVREKTLPYQSKNVVEVFFTDTRPNTCYITNKGNSNLYCSRNRNVNTSNYEILIPANAINSIVKPQEFSNLYFYSEGVGEMYLESFVVSNLSPSDIPKTQQVIFVNNQPITLGNIEKINQEVLVKDMSTVLTKMDTIIGLLTDIKTNTTPTTP